MTLFEFFGSLGLVCGGAVGFFVGVSHGICWGIGGGLLGVYTFLYVTLRQQDYALLMGTVALFVLLGIVMWVTRKVDWYARDTD